NQETNPQWCREEVLCLISPPSSKIRVIRGIELDYFLGLGRSLTRITKRSPDQVSSTAQTLLSTRPACKPISRTRSSVKSVGTPEAFLGQAIQRPPAGERRWANGRNFLARSARLSVK